MQQDSTCSSARCTPVEALSLLDHVLLLPSVASTYQGAEQSHVLKLGDKVVHGESHRLFNHASHSDFVSVPF